MIWGGNISQKVLYTTNGNANNATRMKESLVVFYEVNYTLHIDLAVTPISIYTFVQANICTGNIITAFFISVPK